jgi:hypothetical protein
MSVTVGPADRVEWEYGAAGHVASVAPLLSLSTKGQNPPSVEQRRDFSGTTESAWAGVPQEIPPGIFFELRKPRAIPRALLRQALNNE